MKRSRTPTPRVADEARALISRLRALAGIPNTFDAGPLSVPPRRAQDAWEPRANPEASMTLRTRLVDEEGDENELPIEFATATMGHILLGQSQTEAARQMFLAVHARSPDDPEAIKGLELTGGVPDPRPSPKKSHRPTQKRALGPKPTHTTEPWEMLDRAPPPERYGTAEARALAVDPGSVVVFWELTEPCIAEASAGLDPGAAPTLCVVSIEVDTKGLARTERWVYNVPAVGDWFVTDLPQGATHLCAIGLSSHDRFVPIAHAEPVIAPRGKASESTARVRATLVIPDSTDRARPHIFSLSGPADALSVASAQLLVPALELIVAKEPGGAAELFARLCAATPETSPGTSPTRPKPAE